MSFIMSSTTAKCAVVLFPYLSLTTSFMHRFRDTRHTNPEELASATSDETVAGAPLALLVDAIERATRRPPYVRRIAERFVREIINTSSFVAVHWRYVLKRADGLLLPRLGQPDLF